MKNRNNGRLRKLTAMNTCIEGWEKISSHRFGKYGLQRGWKRRTDMQEFSSLPDNAKTPFKE